MYLFVNELVGHVHIGMVEIVGQRDDHGAGQGPAEGAADYKLVGPAEYFFQLLIGSWEETRIVFDDFVYLLPELLVGFQHL